MDNRPPLEDEDVPADKTSSPPDPLFPDPTEIYTEPPRPELDVPDPRYKAPLLPLLDEPELSTMKPLTPLNPASDVRSDSAPLDVRGLDPLMIFTRPPLHAEAELDTIPPDKVRSCPLPLSLKPTDT